MAEYPGLGQRPLDSDYVEQRQRRREKADRAAERLRQSMINRRLERGPEAPEMPSLEQTAMVLRALADHTAIMGALEHAPDHDSPWPVATSVGRWFHDVGDIFEIAAYHEKNPPKEKPDHEPPAVPGEVRAAAAPQEAPQAQEAPSAEGPADP